MSIDIQNLDTRDPFTAQDNPVDGGSNQATYIHIRNQQRNGRKSLTTIQGIDKQYDCKRILKALKKGLQLQRHCDWWSWVRNHYSAARRPTSKRGVFLSGRGHYQQRPSEGSWCIGSCYRCTWPVWFSPARKCAWEGSSVVFMSSLTQLLTTVRLIRSNSDKQMCIGKLYYSGGVVV